MNRWLLIGLLAAAAVGCSDSKPGPNAKPDATQPKAPVNKELLEPCVMIEKPIKALSVQDVLKRNEGETVVVTGRTPPENVRPFNGAVAAFLLMAPQDLDREEIKEELSCEEAATCPACKKILDQYSLKVEVVDKNGAVLPTTLEGFQGLKPGSTITVEGEVRREGKDKKIVRIVAKRFYPG